METSAKEIQSKENELALTEIKIQDCNSKLGCKERQFSLLEKSIGELALVQRKIEECNGELRCKERELGLVQKKIGECNSELDCKERQLGLVQDRIRESESELDSKEAELNFMKKLFENWSEKVDLKMEELSLLQKSIGECNTEVQSKEDKLNSLNNAIENTAERWSQKLILKKEEMSLLQKAIEKYHVDQKQLESLESSIKDFSLQIELKEKKLRQIQSSIEECEKELVIKERQISDYAEKLEAKDTRPLSLHSCDMNNGRNLQLILNQHLQKHDLIFGEISDTLKKASDPALLVLDAMQGFYPDQLREGDVEFESSIIRRSCILLLDQLSSVSPEINPQVRDEAMKVAGEWKEKMRVTVENYLEVLGFLHILAVYRLAPAFDGNQFENLFDIVAQHRQTPKLRQSLGFADKVPEHSIGTSSSSEQQQLQNYYKRPRTEPSTNMN